MPYRNRGPDNAGLLFRTLIRPSSHFRRSSGLRCRLYTWVIPRRGLRTMKTEQIHIYRIMSGDFWLSLSILVLTPSPLLLPE
jgi:hypothetical protein